MAKRVAVLGAGGFVGAAICRELAARGWEVSALRASRLPGEPSGLDPQREASVEALAMALEGVDAVVNAAGMARPASRELRSLLGANAALPKLVVDACGRAGVTRLVHISSAAVQGDMAPLDETYTYRADSPYARSKMLGEEAVTATSRGQETVRTVLLRPTSVHGRGRFLTHHLIRLARSPLSSVAAPGEAPTPQVLVDNVGATAEFLCRADVRPPAIVLQPWEGWTTASFLHLMSGRWPRQISAAVVGSLLHLTDLIYPEGRRLAYRRRLELLWFGQPQVTGWLQTVGFTPPYGHEHWERLVHNTAMSRR